MKRSYSDLQIGQKESKTKTISESDVYLFAGVTGDFNPAHVNKVVAEAGMFKQRIAHGMLAGGFISSVLGTELPGEGAIYISQELKFVAPMFFGDTITAEVEVIEKLEKGRVRLKTICFNQDGKVVVDGEALLLMPREK